jgi:hypothetical protein
MVILEGILKIMAIISLVCLLLGLPLMLLWNWLIPVIFGLSEISFWQAVGLNLLASILFARTSTITNNK